jgi:hypothetical protein
MSDTGYAHGYHHHFSSMLHDVARGTGPCVITTLCMLFQCTPMLQLAP